MGLADLARGLLDKRTKVDPQELRKSRPMRNAFVESESLPDGSVLLSAPLSTQGRGFLGRMAQKAGKPDRKQFELEPVGAFVWEVCDGKHTFEGISRKLRERFKLSKVEADASLSAFLQMLAQRKLITMMVVEKK